MISRMKAPPAPSLQELEELKPAIGDIAEALTRDVSGLRQDLRDAAELAPLAVAKTLAWITDRWATPRRRALIAGGVLLLGLGVLAITCGARRSERS